MHSVVHDNEENARWLCRDVRVPTVEKNGNVVVPVQKDEWFLVNQNEKGIQEFTVGVLFLTANC